MKKPIDILELYKGHQGYLASRSDRIPIPKFEGVLGSIFTPGPYYYYVMDSASLTFDYCSASAQEIIGVDLTGTHLSSLLNVFHPEDMPFVYASEDHVAKFIKANLTAQDILNYKFSYAIRERTQDGTYKLFLMQTVTLATNEEGALEKVMGIHVDISHITDSNSYKLSISDITAENSNFVIEVFPERYGKEKGDPGVKFTKREREIIILIGEGMTTKEISDQLFVSEETIVSHRKNMLYKSACKNTAQLVAFCIKNGLI
ncbi:helix-turn-helix transcriptional regulator [Algoriphagus sp. AGSA1]|uniref:LuxR C-terminal-related transcriptional regulator n=1 Tax=Algoriphagus sp. AGSA1 TaxID=2907213 RepID=UPI001F37817A|nr:LuxR C-terminal-related transcriptional regulator [Algoriphagus sp. AGSA1]MCE7053621.1 helix-turn-helix transcriptional regulator [Algoriphagus sp. AGSA1]